MTKKKEKEKKRKKKGRVCFGFDFFRISEKNRNEIGNVYQTPSSIL
jgi:hypothetical protein